MISEEEYNEKYNMIYGYFYRRVSNRMIVEDLTVDTLSQFYTTEKQIENPKSYVFGIAKNKLREFIRSKSKSEQVADVDEVEVALSGEEYSHEYMSRLEHLKECVEKFTKDKDKELIELCIMCDFSRERVADELGMSYDNVRQRLSRAVKLLKNKCADAWIKN